MNKTGTQTSPVWPGHQWISWSANRNRHDFRSPPVGSSTRLQVLLVQLEPHRKESGGQNGRTLENLEQVAERLQGADFYQLQMPETSHCYLSAFQLGLQAQCHRNARITLSSRFGRPHYSGWNVHSLNAYRDFFPLNHSGQVPGISDTTFQKATPEMCTCPAEESLSNQPPVLLAHKDPNPGRRIVFLSQTFL